MGIFLPEHLSSLVYLVFVLVATLGLGYMLQRGLLPFASVAAWLMAMGGPILVIVRLSAEASGFLMIALILSLLFGMKAVVAVYGQKRVPLNPVQWLAFSLGWLGMRSDAFTRLGEAAAPGAGRLFRKGARFFLLGLVLFSLAKLVWNEFYLPDGNVASLMLVLGLTLPALSLVLHFGLLTLQAGFWRWMGVPVRVLFNAPFTSKSLKEFWGMRWNIAFAEMTAIAVYRPMRGRFGEGSGRAASFFFSGLAHEIAISVPVHVGYGLPTAYFMIQALGTWLEKRFRISGRFWTMLWVLLPAPILFHAPFITEMILPLVERN